MRIGWDLNLIHLSSLINCLFNLILNILNLLFFIFKFIKYLIRFNFILLIKRMSILNCGVFLQILIMVYLKMRIKLDRRNEIFMPDSPYYRNDIKVSSLFFHLYIISDEWVIFKAYCNHLPIWTHIERKRLSIIISSFNCLGHFQCLKIEKPHIIIITCCN